MRYLSSFVIYCCLLLGGVVEAKDLLVFGADWCPNCVKLKTAIEKDPDLVAGFDVLLIDTDREPEIAKAYGVKNIPVLIVLAPGGALRRKVGFKNAADLKKWLREAK